MLRVHVSISRLPTPATTILILINWKGIQQSARLRSDDGKTVPARSKLYSVEMQIGADIVQVGELFSQELYSVTPVAFLNNF